MFVLELLSLLSEVGLSSGCKRPNFQLS